MGGTTSQVAAHPAEMEQSSGFHILEIHGPSGGLGFVLGGLLVLLLVGLWLLIRFRRRNRRRFLPTIMPPPMAPHFRGQFAPQRMEDFPPAYPAPQQLMVVAQGRPRQVRYFAPAARPTVQDLPSASISELGPPAPSQQTQTPRAGLEPVDT